MKEKLPHLYAHKHFKWSRDFLESTNRINILCAANQIGKSTAAIRRHITNATDKKRWLVLWKTSPKMFWYFYPDSKTLDREWNTKWLPLMPDQADPQYGWKLHHERGIPVSIAWHSGVFTYFMFYTKSHASMQAGTVHEISCFTKDNFVYTTQGRKSVADIKDGTLILSHTGFEEVYNLQSREAVVWCVKFSDGTTARCSEDHPFKTRKGWKPVK